MPEGFDFESEYGAHYDRLIRRIVPGYEDLFAQILAFLWETLPERAELLVVGAGSGSELLSFGTRRPGWSFLGVEPSEQMAAIVTERVDAAGLAGRIRLHRGYASDLPPGPRFDGATLDLVLHFLPDDGAKQSLLRDIATRLRPGAPFVLVDGHGEPGSSGFERLMAAWMRYLKIRGMSEDDLATYRGEVDAGVHFIGERRLLELCRAAGFGEPVCFFRSMVFGGWAMRAGTVPDA